MPRWKRGVLPAFALVLLVAALWSMLPWAQGPLRAQDGSPLATPSPTPTKSMEVVNRLRVPRSGDAIARVINIEGTALIPVFNRFEIHISPTGMEAWQWLTTSHRVVYDDVLYRFDTTPFPDGFYDLRVRAINDAGNYTESFVRGVEIRNANPPTPTPLPGATAL